MVVDKTINATCILCGTTLPEDGVELFDTRFGIAASYFSKVCITCGLEQTAPVPSADGLKSLYEKYYNFGGENNTIYTSMREWFLSSCLYRFWLAVDGDMSFHCRRGKGRVLDVGCNEGRGLAIYRRNGFMAEGLELNETAANVARLKGFTVHPQLIEDFVPDDQYDVVILSNVLEHSPDPCGMIANVFRLLKPGGEVWISCPNCRSWLRALFGRFWINWHVPFHLSHFSIKTLGSLLQKEGFAVVESKQFTPALWVSHSVLSGLFARRGSVTRPLRNPMLIMLMISLIRGFCFPLLWLGNILERGDCIVVTAARKA